MLEDLNAINSRMVEFGCSLLGKSLYELTFAPMGGECVHPYAYSSLVQALEIFMKAAIAPKRGLVARKNMRLTICFYRKIVVYK
ncbi:TPA: hypothetical protein JBI05_02590 [Legionella pneumophila]|nr:hypothetical protein [Legionella pneumophila]